MYKQVRCVSFRKGIWNKRFPYVRLTIREQLTLSFLWFSLNAPVRRTTTKIVIPTQILYSSPPAQVGNVTTSDHFFWLAFNIGSHLIIVHTTMDWYAVSDRTLSALWRRRPYIIGGTICVFVSVSSIDRSNSTVTVFSPRYSADRSEYHHIRLSKPSLLSCTKEQRGEASAIWAD